MAFQKLCPVLLALLCIAVSTSATTQLYVASSTSATCPGQPCLTLSEYLNNTAQYFTSNTSFCFLEGEHHLNRPLILTNVKNINLTGVNTEVQITLAALANNIISFINSSAVTLSSLQIILNYRKEGMKQSSVLLSSYGQDVKLLDIHFKLKNQSRALHFLHTDGEVTNCSFTGGYSQQNGDAINMNNSIITFTNVHFTENIAKKLGGAIYADNSLFAFYGKNLFFNNHVQITSYNWRVEGATYFSNCDVELSGFNNFTKNIGGLVLLSTTLKIKKRAVFYQNENGAISSLHSQLKLYEEIYFINNKKTVGGAILAYESVISCHGDMQFKLNIAKYGGAISTFSTNLTLMGNITFEDNRAYISGGGVYVNGDIMRITGSIYYTHNKARFGGGMWIDNNAQLVLKSPASVQFYNNHAEEFGGAIYVSDSDDTRCQTELVGNCFYKVKVVNTLSLDTHLNFSHNSAYTAGTALYYSGALELCEVKVQNISTFIPSFSEEQNTSIASKPLKACFCENGTLNCRNRSKMVSTVPGRTFNLYVVTVGQYNVPVGSKIQGHLMNEDISAELHPQSYSINKTCTKISVKLLTKLDHERIELYPKRCTGSPLYVNVTFAPCPNGFVLINNKCKCDQLTQEITNVSCDIQTGLIRISANNWIRPLFHENQTYLGFLWHSNCPYGYCKSVPSKTKFTTSNSDIHCRDNRVNITCGACKSGYSLTLNNFKCKKCDNKFISLILLFGIAGIVLVVILFASHMTVAAGTINGLILYANIVNIHRSIFFPPDQTSVNPLSIFIAWLNLDLGIPTCFYDGLDSYAYAWLQYVFPFYLWLLIGAIILSSKFSVRAGRLFGSNPVAVLATVILMSYTKLLETTLGALDYTSIHVYLKYSIKTSKKVWIFDGNIAYFGSKHAPLAIVAILVIIFLLLPYILLLTLGYRLQACSGKKGFLWFNKFTPLLDAYYAPYRKNTRYWTGLMLLVRVCLFIIYIVNLHPTNLLYVESFVMAIAVLSGLNGGIYRKLYVNIIEASFVLNIGILSSVTHHIQREGGNQAVATYLSVGIALTEFVGIVMFHMYLSIKSAKFFREWKYLNCLRERLVEMKIKKMSSVKVETAKTTTTSTLIEIREPLLESVITS